MLETVVLFNIFVETDNFFPELFDEWRCIYLFVIFVT